MKTNSFGLSLRVTTCLALGFVTAWGCAIAAQPPAIHPPSAPAAMRGRCDWGGAGPSGYSHRRPMLARMETGGPWAPARRAAMREMVVLQHLYLVAGHRQEAIAMYRQVLAQTHDQMLRTFAYEHLARLQAMPSAPDQAIATLRKALAEDLKALPETSKSP